MARQSTQHKLDRVRPPRVQITYDVEVGGAIELKELVFPCVLCETFVFLVFNFYHKVYEGFTRDTKSADFNIICFDFL